VFQTPTAPLSRHPRTAGPASPRRRARLPARRHGAGGVTTPATAGPHVSFVQVLMSASCSQSLVRSRDDYLDTAQALVPAPPRRRHQGLSPQTCARSFVRYRTRRVAPPERVRAARPPVKRGAGRPGRRRLRRPRGSASVRVGRARRCSTLLGPAPLTQSRPSVHGEKGGVRDAACPISTG